MRLLRHILSQRGFTLIEAVMSIVIGGFILISLGLETGAMLSSDNRYRIYAANAVREELEILRNTNYDTFVALGSSSSFSNAQTVKIPNMTATRSIATTSFGSDIRKLTLTVSWTSRTGIALKESLTTYVTRKGLNGS